MSDLFVGVAIAQVQNERCPARDPKKFLKVGGSKFAAAHMDRPDSPSLGEAPHSPSSTEIELQYLPLDSRHGSPAQPAFYGRLAQVASLGEPEGVEVGTLRNCHLTQLTAAAGSHDHRSQHSTRYQTRRNLESRPKPRLRTLPMPTRMTSSSSVQH